MDWLTWYSMQTALCLRTQWEEDKQPSFVSRQYQIIIHDGGNNGLVAWHKFLPIVKSSHGHSTASSSAIPAAAALTQQWSPVLEPGRRQPIPAPPGLFQSASTQMRLTQAGGGGSGQQRVGPK